MPSTGGSGFLLLGLCVTWMTLTGNTPSALAHHAAVGVGISLAGCLLFEVRHGIYGLVRTDNMALIAAYGLTLLEFLFDQPAFDSMVQTNWVRGGILACLVGFGGLAVGRIMGPKPSPKLTQLLQQPVPTNIVLRLFWLCFAIGYFNMLLAVNFDVETMVYYWGTARFTQPWGRGKFGDWKALLYELSMLLYLIPPIGGVIIARAWKYKSSQVTLVFAAVVATLFYGFASGTRNLFGAYLITFLVAYLFAQPKRRLHGDATANKRVYVVAAICLVLMAAAVKIMLAFRNQGLWNYIAGGMESDPYLDSAFFVDYNLWVISIFTNTFPSAHGFLGWEIPWQALIRPIPRALWAGKPEGLSVPIEEVIGVQGLTLASSFVGESFMSGGYFGVFLAGLFFGGVARWWNGWSSHLNSDLGVLIYASGFFAIAISMRSLFVFTTAMLPTLAALVYCYWIARHSSVSRQQSAIRNYQLAVSSEQ